MATPKTPLKEKPPLIDARLVEALSHPIRSHALSVLTQRSASATELAREVEGDPRVYAYHLKKLLDLGCVEPVHERKVRAATEVFYRATVRHYFDAAAWKEVPDEKRLKITMNVLRLVSSDLGEALEAGTADEVDRHLSRTVMKVDQAGWLEILTLLETTLEELQAIRERAITRMDDTGEKPRLGSVSMLHFETPRARK